MTDNSYVVCRVEQDDGSWNAQPEYLYLVKPYGLFEWYDIQEPATKMKFVNAVMLSWVCRLSADEFEDKDKVYSYSVKEV